MALPTIAAYPLPTAADIPHPRAPFQPEAARMALLIHDMQRYFVAAYGDAPSPLGEVTRNIARLAQSARAAGVPVFYTAQHGDQFRPDRGLQADLWGPGMRAIPEHQDIIAQLAPQPGDIVLVKHRYSAFQRSNLAALMRARGRDQLAIAGVYAHIGCLATAAEAFQRDIQPFAVFDAQADFDRPRHDMAMNWVASCCGVPLSTDALCAAISQGVQCN